MHRIRRSFRRGELPVKEVTQSQAEALSYDVFICHDSPEEAQAIERILKSRKQQVAKSTMDSLPMEETSGTPSSTEHSSLEKVSNSKVMVLVVDQETLENRAVQKEVLIAVQKGLKIHYVLKRKADGEAVISACPSVLKTKLFQPFEQSLAGAKKSSVLNGETDASSVDSGRVDATTNITPYVFRCWIQYTNREPKRSIFVQELLEALSLFKRRSRSKGKNAGENALQRHLDEYEDGTRKWVFREVIEWFITPAWANRLAVITGLPGSGKTVVCAKLASNTVNYQHLWPNGNYPGALKTLDTAAECVGFYFFDHHDVKTNNIFTCIRTISKMLQKNLPEYREAARKLRKKRKNGQNRNNSNNITTSLSDFMNTTLVSPLRRLKLDAKNMRHRKVIVLDAIDEMRDAEKQEFIHWVELNWKKQMPNWLGLIVSARPDTWLLSKMSHFVKVDLDQHGSLIGEDISNMFKKSLFSSSALMSQVNSAELRKQIEKIALKCEGSYMFAKFVRDGLTVGSHPHQSGEEEVWDRSKPFNLEDFTKEIPTSLDDIYATYFRQLEGALGQRCYEQLLSLTLAARVPLPLMIWQSISTSLDKTEGTHEARSLEEIRNNCRRLLTFRSEQIRFIHKSMREWLLRSGISSEVVLVGHKHLAVWAWSYLVQVGAVTKVNAEIKSDVLDTFALPQEHPKLTEFAMSHVFYHLCRASMFHKARGLILCFDWLLQRVKLSVDIYEDIEKYYLEREIDQVAYVPSRRTLRKTSKATNRKEANSSPRLTRAAKHASHKLSIASKQPKAKLGPAGQSKPTKYIVQNERDVRLIASVLRLSKPILSSNPLQLASQILARIPRDDIDGQVMREQALKFKPGRPWWRPLSPTLELADSPLIQVISGHDKPIDAVAVSPNGKQLASGGRDGKIILWDVDTGKMKQSCEAVVTTNAFSQELQKQELKDVNSVSFSHDGSYVAAGYDDGVVLIWHTETGQQIQTLKHHKKRVWCVSFSQDGKYLVSVSDDNTMALFGTPQNKLTVRDQPSSPTKRKSSLSNTFEFDDQDGAEVTRVADLTEKEQKSDRKSIFEANFSGIAKKLGRFNQRRFSIRRSKKLEPIKLQTEAKPEPAAENADYLLDESIQMPSYFLTLLATLGPFQNAANSVSFSHDSRRIVAGFDDKIIRSFSVEQILEQGKVLSARDLNLSTQQSTSTEEDLSEDSNDRVQATYAPTAQFQNSHTPQQAGASYPTTDLNLGKSYTGHRARVRSVQFSPKTSNLLVSCSDDHYVIIWSAVACVLLHRLQGHEGRVYGVSFSPEENYVASASADRSVRLWDVNSGNCLHVFLGHADPTMKVVFIDQDKLVSASLDKTIRIWKISNALDTSGHFRSNRASLGRRSRRLGTKSYSRSASFGVNRSGHSKWVVSVAVSKDGKYIVTGSQDKTVCVWNSSTAEPLRKLVGHTNTVWHVIICPNTELIASGSPDMTLRIWDLHKGTNLHILIGHRGSVSGIAFAHTKKLVASGSMDSQASLWDVSTGSHIRSFVGHTSTIAPVCFSRDDEYLVTGSSDDTCKVWDVETGQVLHTLKKHKDLIRAISISKDKRLVVTGCDDGVATIWNLKTGSILYKLRRHEHQLRSAILTEDGRHVVTTDRLNNIVVWCVKTGEEVRNQDATLLDIPYPTYETDGMQGLPLHGTGLITKTPKHSDGIGFSVDIGTLNTRKLTTLSGNKAAIAEGDKIHILTLEK